MIFSRFIIRALLVTFIGLLLLEPLPARIYVYQVREQLAGSAIFPTEEYRAWLQTQQDEDLGAQDKIISTINTYFRLKFESWMRGTLLDFGFVFNLNDTKAWNDYAYERGIFYVNITGWKLLNMLLTSYEYLPEFRKIEVDGDKALVDMFPEAKISTHFTPDRIDPTPWSKHAFELVLLGGQWLIQKINCDDPFYYAHPRGTDFDKAAERLAESIKADKAKIKSQSRKSVAKERKKPFPFDLSRIKNAKKKGFLNAREVRVLKYRFGLDGMGKRTLHQIGGWLGISHTAVRKIEQKALKRVRDYIETHKRGKGKEDVGL